MIDDAEKQIEKLTKDKEILHKSNQSQFRKTSIQVNKLQKKTDKQEKSIQSLLQECKEKDKAI